MVISKEKLAELVLRKGGTDFIEPVEKQLNC
jgi:hypothetical protein